MQEVEYFNDTTTTISTERMERKHSRKCSYDLLDGPTVLPVRQTPQHHRTAAYNKCDENVNYTADPLLLTSSDEDSSGSPTGEMNNCIKFMEKPALIKRFALGFLRSTEESLPLMCHKSSPTSPQKKLNDILSEDIYTLDQIVSSKFGDSCKQSFGGSTRLLSGGNGAATGTVPATTTTVADGVEYEFKRNLIRQTNSASSSPKRFPTVTPPKHADSLNSVSLGEDSEELNRASWFQAGLPRELSLEVLTQQSPGAFLVRRSTTKHGCFALSLRVPPGPGPKVVHYLIMKTERGYKIKGFTKEFSSLRALITHHSVMPEMLPVPLSLPRPQNIPMKCKHTDDYDTFSALNEFSKLFSDLDICS
ncbi:EGFR adapter protein-like [Anopheles funestus]|uniref:EGFR adapter protein-like n=1 Tax=Anopheles funestus TaxID=62324 RepID=UPI0020C5D505|nr:EGFR adapter protein-like [Anopheles funestus]XP_049286918.1 EGFR adapter protein-like [Anopheles funestus]